MRWECAERNELENGVTCESKAVLRRHSRSVDKHRIGEKTGEERESPGAYDEWADLVTLFSGRLLTVTSDRLPALSGAAKKFSRIFDDEYLAGHWKKGIFTGLLWQPDALPPSCRPTNMPYRAPSWSWASVEGPVRMLPTNDKFIADFVNASVTPKGANKFGEVVDGFIDLRACCVPVSTHMPGDGSREPTISFMLDSAMHSFDQYWKDDKYERAWIEEDVSGQSVTAVVLCLWTTDQGFIQVFFSSKRRKTGQDASEGLEAFDSTWCCRNWTWNCFQRETFALFEISCAWTLLRKEASSIAPPNFDPTKSSRRRILLTVRIRADLSKGERAALGRGKVNGKQRIASVSAMFDSSQQAHAYLLPGNIGRTSGR